MCLGVLPELDTSKSWGSILHLVPLARPSPMASLVFQAAKPPDPERCGFSQVHTRVPNPRQHPRDAVSGAPPAPVSSLASDRPGN